MSFRSKTFISLDNRARLIATTTSWKGCSYITVLRPVLTKRKKNPEPKFKEQKYSYNLVLMETFKIKVRAFHATVEGKIEVNHELYFF